MKSNMGEKVHASGIPRSNNGCGRDKEHYDTLYGIQPLLTTWVARNNKH